ncbi:MAG: hypothetical protein EA360_03355 [Balneolaceae bacterium]|nr:MAG: hypothetical protein EA360_03355 [Balneolaceae bacterium]
MKTLNGQLGKINTLSREILYELEKDEPSVDEISERIAMRNEFIESLDPLIESTEIESLSDLEKTNLETLFNQFMEINITIRKNLNESLTEHEINLASATKVRKAEESYTLSDNPDLSYFTNR